MNTIDDNKLIAEFMGWKEQTDPTERWFGQFFNEHGERKGGSHREPLLFHTSWDWLMPVVEKIEDNEEIDVNILLNGTHIFKWRTNEDIVNNVANISFDKKIEHTYSAVVEFIKWYNENK